MHSLKFDRNVLRPFCDGVGAQHCAACAGAALRCCGCVRRTSSACKDAHRQMEWVILSYDPTGGHTDQLRSLSLALAVADLLQRTLILPPYLHHRDCNVQTARRRLPALIASGERPALSSLIDVSSPVPWLSGLQNGSHLGLSTLARHLRHAPCSISPTNFLAVDASSSLRSLACIGWSHRKRTHPSQRRCASSCDSSTCRGCTFLRCSMS